MKEQEQTRDTTGTTEDKERGVLRAVGMAKSYGEKKVVSGVDLDIFQGEIVGLLGPNGAGKTTTFYMLAGLALADGGAISLNGQDITSWPIHLKAAKGIGYLPQEASVFRDLTVEENIVAVLETRKVSRARIRHLADKCLNQFGLESLKKSKGRELSGGERKRVEVARAFALNPKFVLFDEPFAGVDPIATKDLQATIRQLKKDGVGILITDHNVRETLNIVDRAYIINQGRVLATGTPQEIIQNQKARDIYLGDSFQPKEGLYGN